MDFAAHESERLSGSGLSAGDIIARARERGPDPWPDESVGTPTTRAWFYSRGQFELAALRDLVDEGFAANKHVDYAGNYGSRESVVSFRHDMDATETRRELRFWATGDVSIVTTIDPASTAGVGDPEAATDVARGWTCSAAAIPGDWHDVSMRLGGDVPPHRAHEPIHRMALEYLGRDLWRLDAPALGRLFVASDSRPVVAVGESDAEALADDDYRESRCEVDPVAPGLWATRHRLGFQYAVVRGTEPSSVFVEANVRHAPARGGFISDDPVLDAIWATSAFTLRTCMQVFVLDGIKRDRMPWVGDLVVSTIANAYAFADGEVIRTGLRALGRPRHGFVNGIADYSLWWVIGQSLYQRYFGDAPFAQSEAAGIHAFLANLAVHCDADGVFRPGEERDAFVGAGPGAVFIDWGVVIDDDRDSTALQMLWYWAVVRAGELLRSAGHPEAARWLALGDRIADVLRRRAWDESANAWREYLDDVDRRISPYPNLLAVLNGLSDGLSPGVREAIEMDQVGTPFMRSFAIQARAAAGDRAAALEEIRRSWGPMLVLGGAFWEEFPRESASDYEMYGRPFGKSLCHAWASSPTALIPSIVLGIRPLSDGWRTFEVDPDLGSLAWAAAVVPVPTGRIVVTAYADGAVIVDIPAECKLIRGDAVVAGPRIVDWAQLT